MPTPRPGATSQNTATAPVESSSPAPPTEVLAVVRRDDPAYPTTQPLDLPADLTDAAKIVLHHPAYVDPLGNLWLTHPAGRPIAEVLQGPIVDHTAVIREKVLYVHWPPSGHAPVAVYVAGGGRLRTVTATAPEAIDNPLDPLSEPDFAATLSVGDGAAVPTRTGATVLFAFPIVTADLVAGGPRMNRPVMAATADGALLWSPWENGRPGSVGATRLDASGAHPLSADDGWPAKPIQLIPLGDGGVLTVGVGDHGPVLKFVPPPSGPPAAGLLRTVEPLARQLASEDPVARENAQRQLEAVGPSALPTLESLRETLPPEAQVRIESLLGERLSPTLGGLRPLDGAVTMLARFPGGGCVLRLEGGGTVDDDGADTPIIPAVVSIRPGRPIEHIDAAALAQFDPARQSIQSAGGEVVRVDPDAGPQRWVGSQLFPILPPTLNAFDTLAGVDARRRWLFTSTKRPGAWLLVDPTLPDVTPKLPVWTVDAGDASGWTDAGWPAVRRGDRLLVLEEHGWKDGPVATLRTQVSTTSTTDSSSKDRPIAIGGHAFVYDRDGTVRRFASAAATASGNQPEASFPTGVPAATRVWADPAGRLILVAPGRLAIAFPDGRVPADLAALMLRIGD